MQQKECPGCALEVEPNAKSCPYCGYEFPSQPLSVKIMTWIMVILLVLWLVL